MECEVAGSNPLHPTPYTLPLPLLLTLTLTPTLTPYLGASRGTALEVILSAMERHAVSAIVMTQATASQYPNPNLNRSIHALCKTETQTT